MNLRIGLTGAAALLWWVGAFAADTPPPPLSLGKFLAAYKAYEKALGGVVDEPHGDRFYQSVIQKRGIDFAPSPAVRKRLVAEGVSSSVVAALPREVSSRIGMYVFAFKSKDDELSQDFAGLVHRAVENQKGRIREIVDKRDFPTTLTDYNAWKTNVSDYYSFVVTGEITTRNGQTNITAKVRFRAARSGGEESIEVKPLVVEANPDQDAADRVATWYVDAVFSICRP